jgi:hypothetical protein
VKRLRFVDVSGVGNSGKSAVVDLLREVAGVDASPYWFEFDFIRIANGLLDLRHRLVEDWSPTRAHYAIKLFVDTAEMTGIDPRWCDILGLLRSTSQRYDRHFGGQFVRLSREFAESFTDLTYKAEWPYDDLQLSPLVRFARKVLIKLGMRSILRRNVILASGAGFDDRATTYLNTLFGFRVATGCETVVLNNFLEPFNPLPGLDMIAGARQIVVTRDPRDVFVSGLNRHKVRRGDKALLPFDNDGLNKSFLATDDVREYVIRQRIYYGKLYRGNDRRVLHVRFEDMCTAYDESVARIFRFLDLDAARHVAPRTRFIPEKSSANVGLWRRYSDAAEIAYIARELPDLLAQV